MPYFGNDERKLRMASFMLGYVKRTLPLKRIFVLFAALLLSVMIGYSLYSGLKKELMIVDGNNRFHIKTMGDDVETVFEQIGVGIESWDYVSVPLTMVLSGSTAQEVFIKRAVPVNIYLEGRTTQIMTYYDTVGETIEKNGIVIGLLDRVKGHSLSDPILAGMDIKIIRVREELLIEKEDIPYTVIQTPDEVMNRGEQKITQKGIDGILEKYYKLTYEDGRITARDFLEEKIAEEPVNELVQVGTVPNFNTSRGDLVRYSKVLEMNATAYTSRFSCTGKNPGDPEFGICYTGMNAREGIIAVDTKVIPLYTKVYVEVVGSTKDYGFAIAGDIGSAIKGNLIDLYFDSGEAVDSWGKKKVRVYILNEQNDTRWKTTSYTK